MIKPSVLSAGVENQIANGSEKFIEKNELAPCGCLIRTKPPPRPDQLPFECIEENIPRMRQWLLDRYAGSTFNKCSHQTLPLMEGPPISILIDEEAKPVCFNTPATIPLHWMEDVKKKTGGGCEFGCP